MPACNAGDKPIVIARIFQGYYLTSDGRITHFARTDLSCRCSCGIADMREEVIDALEGTRLEANRPMTPTSGIRCAAWNARKGGVADSPHKLGLAVDLIWAEDIFALWLLLRKRFRRVCMYSKARGQFCHADMWITDKIIWDVVTIDGNFLLANFMDHYKIPFVRDAVNDVLEAT
jgi:zinc D-Ala-D-Ala carboxypeptidase